jgi:hypothetical protein
MKRVLYLERNNSRASGRPRLKLVCLPHEGKLELEHQPEARGQKELKKGRQQARLSPVP